MTPGRAEMRIATVEYRCALGHSHHHPALDVTESLDGGRGIRFKQNVNCPVCVVDPSGWTPPSRIVALWWEPE